MSTKLKMAARRDDKIMEYLHRIRLRLGTECNLWLKQIKLVTGN